MPGGGGAILGAVGSIVGGLASGAAAKKGAEAQLTASREANELQKYIYENNIELMEPWYNTGVNALAQMNAEMGLTPSADASYLMSGPQIQEVVNTVQPAAPQQPMFPVDDNRSGGGYAPGNGPPTQGGQIAGQPTSTTTFRVGDRSFDTRGAAQAYVNSIRPPTPTAQQSDDPYAKFRNTPGYQFQLEEGQRALNQAAAAKGMRFSSDTVKGLQDFGQGLADQTYGNYWNRLAAMSGTGQTAANTSAGYGQNYANAAGQNLRYGGEAKASGYMGQANALNGTINSLFSVYGGAQAGLFGNNPWSFGGGGGGGNNGFTPVKSFLHPNGI